jgi:hypothetical protein
MRIRGLILDTTWSARPALAVVTLVVALSVPFAATVCSAAAGSGGVVYATDFSDPATTAPEWDFSDGVTSEAEEGVTYSMTPGAYTIAHTGAKNVWSGPDTGRLPNDQVVEATVTETTGSPSLIAGVVCRGDVDDRKGYGFFIGLDGYYSIGTFGTKGARLLANTRGTKRTDAVDPTGPNTVRGECTSVGTRKVRLTLVVNGEEVATAVDRTSPSKIGPSAYLISEVPTGATGTVTYSSFGIAKA